ncbi:hypothetical protein ANOM_011659 [Aspergillus nomiae NRRL 13137]|uniref:Uncharacterized protein n=1 Tax=Aspergillus nomiae NRRL (strain ATCC 15546 / NRRL 13137 / CBS 260.88 / M93) TaxID=1509407 RepID=A0A0L1IKR7_ASPN3|nr:uncharacterized protein ANOM_011659 [Aspergillus nomiae NRRL 13137]KNG80159.1 hypothetical protein ANOM_011659 [Aspergillus nomiae NRRL 13137]
MSIFSKLFRSCIQGRRRQRQKQKHERDTPPAVPPKDPVPYSCPPGVNPDLVKKPSIRIVAKDEDDEGRPRSGCGGGSHWGKAVEAPVKVSEETFVAVEGDTGFEGVEKDVKDEEEGDQDEEKGDAQVKQDNEQLHCIPERPQRKNTVKGPEVRSRMIEDIPEEADKEAESKANEHDDTTIPAKDEQGMPAWRVSRRKSLIEIINLLQATAAAAPKLSSIRLPSIPPKSPLRTRGSAASLSSSVSSVTMTEDEPTNLKKERRMAAVMFRSGRLGNRKSADETMIAAATAAGKEKPLFC